MSRRFLISVAALVLAASTLAPAVAADEPVYINPCFDGQFSNAVAGEPLVMVCGWGGFGGPGKIVSFLNAHTASITVRDDQGAVILTIDPEDFADLWDEPFSWASGDEPELACAGPTGRAVVWFYFMDEGLDAGTYEITYSETLSHPVNDGYQTCRLAEDGSRVSPVPSLWSGSYTAVSTLVVTN